MHFQELITNYFYIFLGKLFFLQDVLDAVLRNFKNECSKMHLTWPFRSNKLRKHLVMMVLYQLIEWFVISEVYSFDPTTTYSYYDFSVMTRLLFKFQNFFFLYFLPIGNKINQLFSFFAFMKLKSALFHFSHVYFSY